MTITIPTDTLRLTASILESADFFSAAAVTRIYLSLSNLASYEGIIFEYIKPLKVLQDDAKIDL